MKNRNLLVLLPLLLLVGCGKTPASNQSVSFSSVTLNETQRTEILNSITNAEVTTIKENGRFSVSMQNNKKYIDEVDNQHKTLQKNYSCIGQYTREFNGAKESPDTKLESTMTINYPDGKLEGFKNDFYSNGTMNLYHHFVDPTTEATHNVYYDLSDFYDALFATTVTPMYRRVASNPLEDFPTTIYASNNSYLVKIDFRTAILESALNVAVLSYATANEKDVSDLTETELRTISLLVASMLQMEKCDVEIILKKADLTMTNINLDFKATVNNPEATNPINDTYDRYIIDGRLDSSITLNETFNVVLPSFTNFTLSDGSEFKNCFSNIA